LWPSTTLLVRIVLSFCFSRLKRQAENTGADDRWFETIKECQSLKKPDDFIEKLFQTSATSPFADEHGPTGKSLAPDCVELIARLQANGSLERLSRRVEVSRPAGQFQQQGPE
jgi:hypothetical protein